MPTRRTIKINALYGLCHNNFQFRQRVFQWCSVVIPWITSAALIKCGIAIGIVARDCHWNKHARLLNLVACKLSTTFERAKDAHEQAHVKALLRPSLRFSNKRYITQQLLRRWRLSLIFVQSGRWVHTFRSNLDHPHSGQKWAELDKCHFTSTLKTEALCSSTLPMPTYQANSFLASASKPQYKYIICIQLLSSSGKIHHHSTHQTCFRVSCRSQIKQRQFLLQHQPICHFK